MGPVLEYVLLEGTESPSQTGGVGGEVVQRALWTAPARTATSMVVTPSRTALQAFCDTCPFVMAAPTGWTIPERKRFASTGRVRFGTEVECRIGGVGRRRNRLELGEVRHVVSAFHAEMPLKRPGWRERDGFCLASRQPGPSTNPPVTGLGDTEATTEEFNMITTGLHVALDDNLTLLTNGNDWRSRLSLPGGDWVRHSSMVSVNPRYHYATATTATVTRNLARQRRRWIFRAPHAQLDGFGTDSL